LVHKLGVGHPCDLQDPCSEDKHDRELSYCLGPLFDRTESQWREHEHENKTELDYSIKKWDNSRHKPSSHRSLSEDLAMSVNRQRALLHNLGRALQPGA
jgi:hypothetical protein